MKIDVSKITGYTEMTVEQKIAALEAMEVPETVDLAGYVKKDVADKYASEAAANKKALQEKQTEEERAAAERDAEWKRIISENEQLHIDKAISEHKANYATLGYDDALSTATAKALASGDMATVFSNERKFLEIREKAIKADVLKNTPAPGGSGGGAEEKAANVEMAKAMGAQTAASLKASSDGLKNYF